MARQRRTATRVVVVGLMHVCERRMRLKETFEELAKASCGCIAKRVGGKKGKKRHFLWGRQCPDAGVTGLALRVERRRDG